MSMTISRPRSMPLWFRAQTCPLHQKKKPQHEGRMQSRSKIRIGCRGCPRGPPARMRTAYSTMKRMMQTTSTKSSTPMKTGDSSISGMVWSRVQATLTRSARLKPIMTILPREELLPSATSLSLSCSLKHLSLTLEQKLFGCSASSLSPSSPSESTQPSAARLPTTSAICLAAASRLVRERRLRRNFCCLSFICLKRLCIFMAACTAAAIRLSASCRSSTSLSRIR
mmetsp:Transcript_112229/g.272580  ORF Transcript_112229/g.272580 Transcript_112229/m.272580 type:complete len:226 (-) Transcript_112229:39-716(-)